MPAASAGTARIPAERTRIWARSAGGEADQVPRALEPRPRRGADVHAELARHEQRERGFPEARGPEEQRVVEGLLALLRRVDRDLERFLDLGLADELVEP